MARQRYDHIIYENIINSENNQNTQNEQYSEKCFMFGYLSLSSLCVFVLSCIDISFSYLNHYACQNVVEKTLDLSLHSWLRVNAIFGFCYYVMLTVCFLKRNTIRQQRDIKTSIETLFAMTSTYSIIWLVIGHYLFLKIDCLPIYMWSRVIIGYLFYIPNLVYTSYYMLYLSSN
jgi:hypothetical protein